jgi:hypothetical protein
MGIACRLVARNAISLSQGMGCPGNLCPMCQFRPRKERSDKLRVGLHNHSGGYFVRPASSRPFLRQPPFPYNYPLLFVIPSVPGFPTSQLSTAPLMWFSLKRTTCSRPKPQLSTGNPGKPRDLRCAMSVPRPYRSTTSTKSSTESSWKYQPLICHPEGGHGHHPPPAS